MESISWAASCARAFAGQAVVAAWRMERHRDFGRGLGETRLPERSDDEAGNRFLIKVRQEIAASIRFVSDEVAGKVRPRRLIA